MKIYLKRLLTVLVAVAMLFTLAMPAMVFADVEEEQDSAEDMNLSEDPEGSEEGEEPEEVVEPEDLEEAVEPEESEEAVEPEEPEESEVEETLPQIIIQSVEVQSEEEIVSAESYANGGEVGGVVGNNDPQDPGEDEGPDETVTLDVVDGDNITSVLKSTLNRAPLADDGVLTVEIPEGTYTIDQDIPVFSNTTIIAKGATITALHDSASMLWGSHKVNGSICRHSTTSPCEHGGYTQHHDITIDGGTWIRDANEEFTVNKTSILGFRHGENLTIKNAIFEKATDHFLNLSGMRNVEISNCIFKNALQFSTDPNNKDVWTTHVNGQDRVNRFNTLEVIHLDYCSAGSEASTRAYPQDGTSVRNVTVSECKFINVNSGVGTHHYVNYDAPNPDMGGKIVIKNCIANNLQSYFVYGGDFENIQILNNTINDGNGLATIKGTYDGEHDNSKIARVTIKGNTINTRASFEKYVVATNKTESFDKSFGIKVMSANVNITNNKLNGIASTGIYMEGATGEVSSNEIGSVGNDKSGMGIHAKPFISNDSNNNTISLPTSVECTSNIIDTTTKAGIKAEGGSTLIAKKNSILNSGNQGIFVDGANAEITSNTIANTGSAGINIKSSNKPKIMNNQLSGAGDFAITISNSTSANISGNTIAGSGAAGADANKPAIKVDNSKSSSIIDNTINSSSHDAIAVWNSNETTVRGNNIKASDKVGVHIVCSKSVVVSSNTVKNTQGHAFFIEGNEETAASAVISNNTFSATSSNTGSKDLKLGKYAVGCVVEPNTLGNGRESYDPTSSHSTRKCTLKSEVRDGQYYLDGYKNNKFTGLAPDANGKYLFVRKGKFEKFTGLAMSIKDDKYYFAKDGVYNKSFTGLALSAKDGKYYFCKKGKYDNTFTGLALSAKDGKYYFCKNGKYDNSFTGLALSAKDNKYYFARKGKYDKTYTGLAKSAKDGKYYYSYNGKYYNKFTGITTDVAGKKQYYVVNGAWQNKYTGKVKYNKKTYNVVKGVVQ